LLTYLNKNNFDNFLKDFLENKNIKKRTHDYKSLYSIVKKACINPCNIVFDTLLAGYLLDPSASDYSLEQLAAEYGDGRYMDLNKFSEVDYLIIKRATDFLKIINNISQKIKEYNLDNLLKDIEIPVAETLCSMEDVGFKINSENLTDYSIFLERNLKNLEQEIYEFAGTEFNIQSPKQLGEVLFEELGLSHGKRTKRGYSTSFEVLERLRYTHPIIDKVLKFRSISKLKSTYCDSLLKLIKKDGRVHTSFNQIETKTGRLSSTDPNLQNIPVKTELGRELRRFFSAEKNCFLTSADYSQIELRILAHISEDERMIESFNKQEDIHAITASEVFKMPLEFVTPAMRMKAKAVNFGIVYGIGAFSLAKEINSTRKEAEEYINKYFTYYSGVRNYVNNILKLAKEQGYVETLFKRRRYLPELNSTSFALRSFGERAAINMPIQGSAADIIKIAMTRVYKKLKEENLNSKLILQIHDELIIESPENEVLQVQEILKTEMENAIKLKVPLAVKTSTGKTWYDTKS